MSRVDLQDFVGTLCDDLAAAFGAEQRSIAMEVRAEPTRVDLEIATTLAC